MNAMQYPAINAAGNSMCENSPLGKFFKARGWEFTWDFNNDGRWFEVMCNHNIIMQIEEDVTVEDFLKTVKENVPDFDENLMSIDALKPIVKYVNGHSFYIWPSNRKPQWKNMKPVNE